MLMCNTLLLPDSINTDCDNSPILACGTWRLCLVVFMMSCCLGPRKRLLLYLEGPWDGRSSRTSCHAIDDMLTCSCQFLMCVEC